MPEVADAAAAEVGDERLAEAVQQRSAEEDRDAARAGVRVDVGEVRRLDVGGVEDQLAHLGALLHLDAVHLEEALHDADVADVRDVAQGGRGLAEERGDHRLGDEVLRALELDPALERPPAVDGDPLGGHPHTGSRRLRILCSRRLGVLKKCVHAISPAMSWAASSRDGSRIRK
jgi:hypothetical protein